MKNYIFLLFLLFPTIVYCNNKVDILIYSYHRPLQLYALLESIYHNMSGFNDIFVIYRSDTQEVERAYDSVKNDFRKTVFYKQSKDFAGDFKSLTLKVFEKDASYIIFAVDDIIVKDSIDVQPCVQALQKTNAFGFFLRLGSNISYCYTASAKQTVPLLRYVDKDIYMWEFYSGEYDWRYAFNLDMTIYLKETIRSTLRELSYVTPNTLEAAAFNTMQNIVQTQIGLCFFNSKIVNIPLNLIQNDYLNSKHLHKYSIDRLLQLFHENYKINITPLKGLQINSAHSDVELEFIQR